MKINLFRKSPLNKKEQTKILSRYIRIVTGLIVILAVFGVVLIVGRTETATLAQVPTPTVLPEKATEDNCGACHADVHEVWHKGGHGDARAEAALRQQDNCVACHKEIPDSTMPDPARRNQEFTSFWADQGRPNNCLQCHVTGYDPVSGTWKTDGITCEACHSPIPSNHPEDGMPVDKNTDLCRTCHTDTRFGWDAWDQSAHSQNDITCSNCHNPHSTSLKPTDDSATDSSSLCENCHKDMAEHEAHVEHVETGATCVMCHIGPSKGDDDFHQVPDHDFKAKLDACNSCHADQMHGDGKPVSIPVEQNVPAPIADAAAKPAAAVSAAPKQASPYGYVGLATVFGVGGGFLWRKLTKRRSQPKADLK